MSDGQPLPEPPQIERAERLYCALRNASCENLTFIEHKLASVGITFDPEPLIACISTPGTTDHERALQSTFAQWTSLLGGELNTLANKVHEIENEMSGKDLIASETEEQLSASLRIQQGRADNEKTRADTLERELREIRTELTAANRELREMSSLNRKMIESRATDGAALLPPPARRSTRDPDKFDGHEKDVAKRQEEYTTWRTRIALNFAEDSAYFSSEHMKILNILRCLGGDVYNLNQDLLDQVHAHPNDPSKWKYSTAKGLIEQLNKQYETMDLAHEATLKFDKLEQGNRPFQNFLAAFLALSTRCKKTEEQKVEALKRKVSPHIAEMIRTLAAPPKRDDFHAWANQCQTFYNNQTEHEHYLGGKKQPHQYSLSRRHGDNGGNAGANRTLPVRPVLTTTTATAMPNPDNAGEPMQLDAMKVYEREQCFAEGRCFYCKEIGHTAYNCEKKKAADERRALVGSGRGSRGGYPTSRGRGGRGGFNTFHARRMDDKQVIRGGFIEGEVNEIQGKE